MILPENSQQFFPVLQYTGVYVLVTFVQSAYKNQYRIFSLAYA